MRDRLILIIGLVLGLTSASVAQGADWPVVVAKGHFTFSLPPTMELAAGTFRSSSSGGKTRLSVDEGGYNVRAQPKGLNASGASPGQLRAAGIVVNVQEGAPGDYAVLGTKLSIPADELRELNDDLRSGFMQQSDDGGEIQGISWAGTDVVQLEGTQAIRIRYSGKVGGGNADFVVNMYMVQNNDCMYYITLSYLQAEQGKWTGDLRTAFESMRFDER